MVTDYLRYLWPGGFFIVTTLGVMLGGAGCWFGVLLFPLVAGVEYFLEDDLRKRDMRPAGALFMLYIQLIPWLFLWYGLWWFLQTDYQWWEWLGTIISVAGITAAVGLPISHELFHRHESISRFVGDLFAVTLISGDVELEHRKGHHIETSTINDIDTPYRGESVYAFIARLLPFFHTEPWNMEKQRFANKGMSHCSPGNIVLWAVAGYLALFLFFCLSVSLFAGISVLLISLIGQCIVCVFSYVQHYGLIRVPDTAIEIRHAWNHIRPLSRVLTFEIVTHSQHHTDPTVPYWELTPYPDAARVGSAYGYFLLALVPPLWHKRMREHIRRWDENHATAAELQLATEANRVAGWN